jgi:hypothetical protein
MPELGTLGIGVESMISKRPHTIWRPLKRSLPIDGKGLGRLGYAIGVVSIRRRVGKRYSSHHRRASSQASILNKIVAQPDPLAAPLAQEPERPKGGGPRQFLIYPSIVRTYYYRSVVSVQNYTVVLVRWVETCGGMTAGICSRSARSLWH